MDDARESFCLLDEPWIKARNMNGETVELSLRTCFVKASQLRTLANDIPTQNFAILRMLLAILQRSIVPRLDDYEYPSEAWGSLWRGRTLPVEDIESYLETCRDRFDLLDDERPFMQTAGLKATNGSVSEVGKLLSDYPDRLVLFAMRSGKGVESLSYAEAARWLVHVHAFDTSGIKTGVVGDPAVKEGRSYPIGTGWAGGLGGIYFEGGTLAETLLLNLCLCADCRDGRDEFFDYEADLPAWERPTCAAGDESRVPTGYADLYTWQSRRVLLKRTGGRVVGVLLSNGNKLEYHNRIQLEPMTAWRRSLAQEQKLKRSPVYLPFTHQTDRSFWRGLTAVLPERHAKDGDSYVAPGIVQWIGFLASLNGGRELSSTYPLRLHASGFVFGTQNSVVTDMIDDTLLVNAWLVTPEGADAADLAKQCMADTDKGVLALGNLAANIKLADGLDPQLANDARAVARNEAYYELDVLFRPWLTRLSENKGTSLLQQENEWHQLAKQALQRLGEQLVNEADDKAVQGRMIKEGNREEWLTSSKAELRFRSHLNKALPTGLVEAQDVDEEG